MSGRVSSMERGSVRAVVPSCSRGRTGVHLSILLAAFFLAACSGVVDESGRPSQDNTTSQTSVASTSQTSEASNREGAGTAHLVAAAVGATASSTITAMLLPNEPVKEIAAREVLLVGSPSPLEPTLEIAGQNVTAADGTTITTGRIVICKLVLRNVDAQELVVDNVVVKILSPPVNTIIPPLPIGFVDPDLVVECGRGGIAVLALGVESLELGDLQTQTGQGPTAAVNTEVREGVRLNRLRILGPPGAEGFIETLVLERSSVFGRIELRNLQIKELVLDSVTVQN
jgi:hypothetical protein